MKNQGLKNRFPSKHRDAWSSHYRCMVCGMNQWDVLHHIVCPSSHLYVDGTHNKSILNSSPVHNFAHPDLMNGSRVYKYCHFANEGLLNKKHVVAWLLQETFRALMSLDYQLTDLDEKFMVIYKDLYFMEVADPFAPVDNSGENLLIS